MPQISQQKEERILALTVTRSGVLNPGVYLRALNQAPSAASVLNEPAAFPELMAARDAIQTGAKPAEDALDRWLEEGVHTLAITEPEYPALLRTIYEPPLIIFYRGSWPQKFTERPCFAVVGSRSASQHGCDFASDISRELAKAGTCVISGLATGIDAAAHSGALQSGHECPTLAVFGSGVDIIYPTTHGPLTERILDSGGLLVSQFEPGQPPFPRNFLNRNRIIAGMAYGTLVVQAAVRSGSLATARYALEEGREVFAVPGAPFDIRHEGTNNLIRSGATLVTRADDILEVLPILKREKSEADNVECDNELSESQKQILHFLHDKIDVSYDEVFEKFSSSPAFSTDLLALEMAEIVTRGPGNNIAVRKRLN